MKKKIELIMAVILLVSAGFLAKRGAIYVQQSKVAKTQTCIVIDAGHGGDDPGKIGINGEKEKKLNLAIAKKLQKILEKKGYRIVLTRDSDKGLYHRGSTGLLLWRIAGGKRVSRSSPKESGCRTG